MSTEKHRVEWYILTYVPVCNGHNMLGEDSRDRRLMRSLEEPVRRKCEEDGFIPVSEFSISKKMLDPESRQWRGIESQLGFAPEYVLSARASIWLEKAN